MLRADVDAGLVDVWNVVAGENVAGRVVVVDERRVELRESVSGLSGEDDASGS